MDGGLEFAYTALSAGFFETLEAKKIESKTDGDACICQMLNNLPVFVQMCAKNLQVNIFVVFLPLFFAVSVQANSSGVLRPVLRARKTLLPLLVKKISN